MYIFWLMIGIKMMMGMVYVYNRRLDEWCRDDGDGYRYIYCALKLISTLANPKPDIHPVVYECIMAPFLPLLEHQWMMK